MRCTQLIACVLQARIAERQPQELLLAHVAHD
jgi:hypothetical protein